MKHLRKIASLIGCDKRIHALAGSIIMAILLSIGIEVQLSLLIVTAIAFAVEFYQKATNTGEYDNIDAVAVIVGGIIVLLPVYLNN